jgi:hypothetical protein
MTGAGVQAKETGVEKQPMRFSLQGFSQDMGFRVFVFEGIAADRTRTPFTVKTDLALVRRYGIRLQELPLLCREVLERRDDAAEKRAFTYSEAEMSVYAEGVAAREKAAQKRRMPRRPADSEAGAAWRVPQR